MVEALDGDTDDEKTVKQTQKSPGWTSDKWTVKLKINSTTKEVEGVEATLV